VAASDTLLQGEEDKEGFHDAVNSEDRDGGATEDDTETLGVTLGEPEIESVTEEDVEREVNLLRVDVALPPVVLGEDEMQLVMVEETLGEAVKEGVGDDERVEVRQAVEEVDR